MYNTRRGGGFGTPSSNVGQRRQPQQNQTNFVSGGQLQQNQQGGVQQKQGNNVGTPQGQKVLPKPTVQNKPTNVRPVNTQPAAPIKTLPATPVKTLPPAPVKAVAPPVPQSPVFNQAVKKEEVDVKPKIVPAPTNISVETPMDHDGKTKPAWIKKGKISKAERNRKRNDRLKKILQPKNALMVLNEIVGPTNYELVDIPASERFMNSPGLSFKATVVVDEKVHEGYGKSKPLAKNAAAEAALKHLVLTKFKAPGLNDNNMETEEIESKETDGKDNISYSHLASYALFKLFNSWDDALPLLNRSHNNSTSSLNLAGVASGEEEKPMLRPSKKMPESPEKMNPVMLLNQMHPEAVYEEICQTGSPPHVVFTMKCTVGNGSFVGSGSSKKVARREAAYQACREVLQIKYE